ncbi:MAG TPA: hemin uptake protein HemP [Hydrogenophaga sp.]|uniref:hemin uptake protein HemP n=1 Tax=Hydrogenophaga sp. TaxID=1904254 RepID=UPI002CC6F3BD|nr:hemin uptake protein HemP [Hydrogenophaga sp.]HSX93210.1 hemin uptake protein HemP [Hydrogenophaga sp.]
MPSVKPANAPSPASPVPAPAQVPAVQVQFGQLSGGRRDVFIEHDGQHYKLSLTAQNKLILTK